MGEQDNAVQRDLGRVEGLTAALGSRMDRHETTVAVQLAGIEASLKTVVSSLAQNRGGIRAVHFGIMIAISLVAAAPAWGSLIYRVFGVH